MEQAAAKYRAAPDTVFHASHALLLKILTNIVSEPDEAKYRTVMKGNAYATLVAAPGAAEVLAFLGFQNMPDRIVLPAGAAVEPSHLDYVLQMAEHRARERESKQAAELAKEKARKAAEKKLLEDRIAANRKEVAQRNPTVTSRSTLVPFSNKDKVGLKDIGAGDAAAKGG